MRSAVFLSARNKATRLPGKAFLDLAGRTVTERLIERLKRAEEPEVIALCTSTHPDDASLVEIARRNGIEAFCGSEDDKLDRYLEAAGRFGVDFAVIVDGDDPFCDPGYIDRIIRRAREGGADYICCTGLPVGVGANGVRVAALDRVCTIKTERDTEVWGGYFTQTGLFKVEVVTADPADTAPELRMTLDYPEDYEFFQAVYQRLHIPGRVFSLDEILGLIRQNPSIGRINQSAQTKYEANLQRITRIGIRSARATCGS